MNIVDVIRDTVDLTRNGRHFLGLCPFHNEKTPSFNVLEDKQFYHCFGCGKSGDVFKFIEETRQVPFLESVKIVADYAGIPVDISQVQHQPSQKNPQRELLAIHQDAAKFYHAILMTTKEGQLAREYLAKRGLSDELLKEFMIGLSPNQNDFFYRSIEEKYQETTIFNSGLFHVSQAGNTIYDAFKNRIMFPLTNDKGEVIAFSGRIWQEEQSEQGKAKYKNSTGTPIFNKSYELYHLDKAKATISKTKEVYLMEGFMDVIAAYRAGISNAVASMGTALTPEHIRHLKKFAKKIILTYDGDSAGQNATAKVLEHLTDLSAEIVRMPDHLDPDEFLQKHSPKELAQLLESNRISSVEFFIHYLKPKNKDNIQSEIAYVEKISKIIATTPSITAQNTYINLVADLLPDFDYFQVEQAVNNERLLSRSQIETRPKQQFTRIELPVSKSLSAVDKAESQLLYYLCSNDYLLQWFRLQEGFVFDSPGFQVLYNLLEKYGEISSMELNKLDNQTQEVYYRALEENLPTDITEAELLRIMDKRDKLLQERELKKSSQLIRKSSQMGDIDTALATLEQLINQKRNIE